MSVTVGEIAVDIRAKFDKLQGDINQAKQHVESGANSIKALTTIVAGYVSALGLMNLGGMVESVIHGAAALKDLSEKTGATVEGLSALRSVAKLSDTSMDTVAGAMNKLSKAMVDADEDTKGAGKALTALGINVEDFKKLSPDQQMLAVAQALDQFHDGAQKTQAAMLLFGKSGAEVLPMLNDLAEKGSLNGKITKEQAAAADAFEKQMVRTKASLEGFARSALIPLLGHMGNLEPLFKTAIYLAGAYFAVFIAGPSIMTAATAALAAFQTMQVQAALAGMEGVGALKLFNLALLDTAAATKAAVLEMGIFKSAALLGMAAFAGWEIGKWLSEEFVEVKLAGIALVEGLLVLWERMKFGAQVAWLAIKSGVMEVIGAIGSGWAKAIDLMAAGMEKIGAKGAADSMHSFSESLRTATSGGKSFTEQYADLSKQLDKNVGDIRKITGEMADEAIAHDKAKGKAEEHKKELTGLGAAAQAVASPLQKVIDKLQDEYNMLGKSSLEQAIHKAQVEAGTKANSEAGREIAALVTKVDAKRRAVEWMTQAEKEAEKATEDWETSEKAKYDGTVQAIEAERTRIATLGMGKAAVAGFTLANMEQELQDQRSKGASEEVVESLQKRIDKQRELVGVLKDGEAADAMMKAAADAAAAWKKATDDIEKSITDSLMHGFNKGKDIVSNVVDTIKNVFKTLVLRPIVQAVVDPMVMGAASLLGFPGGAMAGNGAGAVSGIGNLLSAGQSILSNGMAFLNGSLINYGATKGVTGLANWMMDSGSGTLQSAGAMLGNNAGWLSQGLGMSGNAFASYGISKALSGQYSAGGWVNTAAALASMIPGVGPIAGVVGGLINRAFGMGPKKAGAGGLEGTFGSGTFSGQNWQDWHQDGGWFRSDKNGTDHTPVSADQLAALKASSQAVYQSVAGLAESLKLPVDHLNEIQKDFRITFTGNAQDDQKAIADVLQGYQDALSEKYRSALVPFQKSGEVLIDTMQRLVVVSAARDSLNSLGGIFSKIAANGIDATQAMIDLAGGLSNLLGKAQQFANDFYTDQEKAGAGAKAILQQLAAVGVDAGAISDKAGYRALVESLNPNNQGDREKLNALLDFGPQFAQLAEYLKTNNETLSQAAAYAPVVAALDPIFTAQATAAAQQQTSIDQTTQAVDNVTAAVRSGSDATVDAINGLAEVITGAVTTAAAGSNQAITQLNARLEAIESRARLAESAPIGG